MARVRTWLGAPIKAWVAQQIAEARERRYVVHGDLTRVSIDPSAFVGNAMINTVSGSVTIGENAVIAHSVHLLTGTHDVNARGLERVYSFPPTGRDIVVMRGAWVASCAVVIGPCVIGEDAVVAAGSIVTRDVPPRTIVAGNPACVVRELA